MLMQGFNRVVLAVGTSVILTACGTMGSDDSRLRAPNYASPVGTNAWEVNCGVNKVYVEHNRLGQFYKDDGTRKSFAEFCEETYGGIKARNQR